ncbi:DUF899 domain-containing protein [Rhodopirellula sp. MGV]|uniref:DUF899 domain-containing protein n=1 Tax=Rhodopirellula sp. MGV TaxID=2023130 RepID=UPI000B97B7AD|nr:thioredoxin family protein [Rhodopirellula sp. MGV]OYP30436.1 thioredoxin [Rhodopirellula sp. MGV]PNY34782.1 DUF899 domain-containing protein [Rhodopirellula baltica]
MQRKVVSREAWNLARTELLEAEKELTKRSDELAKRRLDLPCVQIDKAYEFETECGPATLVDLFDGRSQLLVYHFMFGPDYDAGCVSCSSIADTFNGIHTHLANHDVTFIAVSRAPLAKLNAYKKRMGWTFPWVSSGGSDFNQDFGVGFTKEQQYETGINYNYQDEPVWQIGAADEFQTKMADTPLGINASMTGADIATYVRERPGMSAFELENGTVYHTYSAFSRGLDVLWTPYQWLDRASKGRNETSMWWKRHDEYDQTPSTTSSCCHA